ncbi:MAG: efflux RND transporter permease subunit [Verrucomicrobiota bacterium JB023]|nr:efflux RND transporter permease subunit [Verrucomicrobiota bacterium JB023]
MISFFARNDIATNILMLTIIVLGVWVTANKIPFEIHPNQEFKEVRINVSYRGGNPADVERDVAIPIEQALEGLVGIKNLRSEVNRENARIIAECADGVDPQDLLEEIKTRVDRVNTFPSETERPRYDVPNTSEWREVISVIVMGELSHQDLLSAARLVRDQLASIPGISQVNVSDGAPPEIAIEADPDKLLQYGLSLSDLTSAIRGSSLDLPAGSIETPSGRVMLRTKGQAYSRAEFENIVVRASNGAEVTLGEVATVIDGYEGEQKIVRFNGVPCLRVEVMRIGEQSAIDISDKVHDYVRKSAGSLPSGITLATWDDDSIALRGRLSTLLNSMAQGAFLVLIVLGLFLRPMLSVWILLGIPVAFAGGLLFMPLIGNTINMMSLFGFIIVLGIVVDDAIVTGEHIYTKLREGMQPSEAAIAGAKEVATPVTFGILTTIVAFIPLMFMPDTWAPFTKPILPVVAPVLLFSLIESKLILPAHLKHLKVGRKKLGPLARLQRGISRGLEAFVDKLFQPFLNGCLKQRYVTLATFVAVALIFMGYWKSGRLGFVSLPSIDRDMINARIDMPQDTPLAETDKMVDYFYECALQLQDEYRDPETGESIITNIMTSSGGRPGRGGTDPEEGSLSFEMKPPEQRPAQFSNLRNADIQERFREIVGPVDEKLRRFNLFGEMRGSGRDQDQSGRSITLEVRGPNGPEKIEAMDRIEDYFDSLKEQGIASTWHDAERGREEIQLSLKPRAVELGLTQRDLADQVRSAFFGQQAQRIQRQRDDLRVMVRLPEKDRTSLDTLDNLILRAPGGVEVPFSAAADVTFTEAPGRIDRLNGAQVNSFSAEVVDDEVDVIGLAKAAEADINAILTPGGFTWVWTGFVADDGKTKERTRNGFLLLMVALYALLAIPFKSLIQPFFVLLAVPFGVIGAMVGHILLGQTPSWLSVFGILALAGVVVNDSLVLVDFINRRRETGHSLHEAVLIAGAKRFRPILLTSLTTFAGLMPLIAEKSLQAQFLKPMAISLAYGILFATFITLILIPTAYLITEDLKQLLLRGWRWYRRPFLSKDESDEQSTPTAEAS